MISVITPAVQRATSRRVWARLFGALAAGAVLGSLLVGSVLAFIGGILQPVASQNAALAIGIGGTLLAYSDIRSRAVCRMSLHRQTNPTWFRRYGPSRACLMWGFDLGLGFSTIRVSSLYWMIVLMAVLVLPPALAPILMIAYGSMLAFSLAAVTFARRRSDAVSTSDAVLRFAIKARLISVAAVAGFTLATLFGALPTK